MESRRLFIMESKCFSWAVLGDYIKKMFRPLVTEKPNRSATLLNELQTAQKEWGYANQYFNLVTDPDLVDLAIYYMGVAEKKYIYLLKKARKSGACVEQYSYR
jgi:hypothetical protein